MPDATCPVCQGPADYDWHKNHQGTLITCQQCTTFVLAQGMAVVLEQARQGSGLLAGRLEQLSRAIRDGHIKELTTERQVFGELNEIR